MFTWHKAKPNIILGILFLFLYPTLIRPLYELVKQSVHNNHGEYIGFSSFYTYIHSPGILTALKNSFLVAISATIITVFLAFILAYTITHTRVFGKKIISALFMLPFFAPSLLPSIGLVYLFGNQGCLKFLLGDYDLYGFLGIIIGLVVFIIPHATLLMITGLRNINSQLYHVAASLGASRLRIFFTITLPNARYSIISATFVSFTLSLTDFGVPKVLGGNFPVLSTEMYSQVLGQQNFGMGSVISLLLLIPTALTFLFDKWIRKVQARLSSQNTVSAHKVRKFCGFRDIFCGFVSYSIILCLLMVIGIVVFTSFVAYWPYDLSFSTINYAFEDLGFGLTPLINSFLLAILVASFGTAFLFLGAYLSERSSAFSILRKFYRILLLFPLGIPGMVLGLAYIFAFNRPDSIFSVLYGTFALLVINTIVYFATVVHLSCADSLTKLNNNLEIVGQTLGVSNFYTFFRVIIPSCKETLFDIFYYLFINAMTTLSAVVFLSSGKNMLASVMVMNLYDSGNIGNASALCCYILLVTISVGVLREIILYGKKK